MITVYIDIRAENPSGYAGEDNSIEVQCFDNDTVDNLLKKLDMVINKVLDDFSLVIEF